MFIENDIENGLNLTLLRQANDLKLALFRRTKDALDDFRKADAKPAESYDDYTSRKTTHAAFHALYSLIEACNLEDEYQAWKEDTYGPGM